MDCAVLLVFLILFVSLPPVQGECPQNSSCRSDFNQYECCGICCKNQTTCFHGNEMYGPYCVGGNEIVGMFLGSLLVISLVIALWNNLNNYQFIQATKRRGRW